jgi:rhomboid protease GluP
MKDDPIEVGNDSLTGELSKIAQSSERGEILEEGLVLTAVGIPFSIQESSDEVALLVTKNNELEAIQEIQQYHIENLNWPPPKPERSRLGFSFDTSLTIASLLSVFFYLQIFYFQSTLIDQLTSSRKFFTHFEWWRPFTALFLHADAPHLVSNLLMSIGLAILLSGWMGSGLTFWGFLFSGTLGNILNAFFYRNTFRESIGFSTAIFGAIGIWAAMTFVVESLPDSGQKPWKKWIIPLGVALALLSGWGASPQSDYMAHFWGLLAGIIYGSFVGFFRLHENMKGRNNFFIALSAFVLIGTIWSFVLINL